MAVNQSMRGIDGKVFLSSNPPRDLQPKEVLIKITHSGLCASDLAYLQYGCVLGHEGVGIVEEVGSQDILCYSRNIFGEGDFNNGTLGHHFIAQEGYVYPIPEEIPSEEAAPLQCAGSTVYSALIQYYKHGMRIGILGIGGLGHLAIQFANKLGAHVTVFSTTASKEEEARQFGAHHFVVLGQEKEQIQQPIDLLLLTGSKTPDWNSFMEKEILARGAYVVAIGFTGPLLEIPFMPTFFNGYNIVTNLVSSRRAHQEMLEFAARNNIHPVIEKFPFTNEGIAAGIEKLTSGKIRYRAVLVW
ncbi:NADP-dependent alcohol dehydrogenase [Trichoderma guizhouense]|uniref:NADP-dependent alcohol dehydrogenase n=1 Tax=Trichoderma guizhouense TaxID=1491466 RepID=A0A1T3CLB5_9HYPO|nr:NADP-dependent alcohol dehydrogenase [Trichoderma guizhouense]